MQTSELEQIKNHLLGDEECINFRPSPNFKHMKKYLKSKFEESNSSPNQSSDQSTTPNSEEQESVKPQQATTNSMAQRKQPPLPPNSPPLNTLVVPKQEVEDDEYNDKTPTKSNREGQLKTEKEEASDKKSEKIMCRQFARGMCNRGSTCIYAHELILSQLPGVYTFCKNFQNTVCTFPKCKFVHATVFEKEHYYRTGFLPPHTLIHLKESNSALGPPTALEGSPAEALTLFSNPPPAMQPGVSSLPTSGSAPPEARPNTELFGVNGTLVVSPVKRDWNGLELEPLKNGVERAATSKCETCDFYEFMEKHIKANVAKSFNEIVELAKQKKELKNKQKRISDILDIVLKYKDKAKYGVQQPPQFDENTLTSNLMSAAFIQKVLDTRHHSDSSQTTYLILQLLKLLKK